MKITESQAVHVGCEHADGWASVEAAGSRCVVGANVIEAAGNRCGLLDEQIDPAKADVAQRYFVRAAQIDAALAVAGKICELDASELADGSSCGPRSGRDEDRLARTP